MRGQSRNPLYLSQIGRNPLRLIDRLRYMAVEIAIGTLRFAKWPMYIQAKAARLPILNQSSPARTWRKRLRDG